MQVRTVIRRSRSRRRRLARLGSAARIRLGMLARLFIAAALFLGFDFLQFGELGGAARLGRAERLCRRIGFRPGSRGLGSIDRRFGGGVSRCVGLRLFHPFLKSTNAGGALLRGKPVLGACLRCGGRSRLWCCLRRGRRFGLLCRGTMRRGGRALAAHLDLHGTSAGAAGCCPQLAGLETAECQPAARQAELLGFAAIVAHHEPFPDNGRKPPPLPMCAR